MITFKNRYAECDNLDDSYNENVLRNCYNREYRKNFGNFRKSPTNRTGNLRYANFNDTRAINNNNYNFNSYQRQNAYTPFPKLPQINSNINYNNISYNDQNFIPSRSSPNMPSIVSYSNNNINYRQTPLPRYNNDNFNISNDNSGFISNNYDTNISNDNILNISNDSQFNQSFDNELNDLERERKLLLEREKLNQLDFELRYLRQKRNADLQRRLAEQQQNLEYINKIKENEIEIENDYNNAINNNIRKINYNYSINSYNNNRYMNRRNIYDNYNYYNNSNNNNIYLEEKLKSNVMNDKLYMNELIDEINKMKISQQETNHAFQVKMNDLVRQNESMKKANQKMIEKIKDMKMALADKKQTDTDKTDTNNDDIFDYLYEKKLINRKKSKFYDGGDENNAKNDNYYTIKNNRYDDLDNLDNIDYTINNNRNNNFKSLDNYKSAKYYLGKKDKDIEEFNMLNKNLINKDNTVVVTPLKYKEDDSKYISDFKIYKPPYDKYKNRSSNTIGNTINNIKNEDLYSLIRKNNDRLEKIKELEEKCL